MRKFKIGMQNLTTRITAKIPRISIKSFDTNTDKNHLEQNVVMAQKIQNQKIIRFKLKKKAKKKQ